MKSHRPLLIGAPFLYQLVDYKLLAEHAIYPVHAYPKTTSPIEAGDPAFYETLSIENIAQIIKDKKIDSIVCYNDNFIIESAKLRSIFNLPGLAYPEALKYKSKSLMYNILKNQMPVPASIPYTKQTFTELQNALGEGEYFIKPDNLAGAEGSFHIRNSGDYAVWEGVHAALEKSFVIQKYLPYPLVHCELIVKKGNIEYIEARKYSYPNHLFLAGTIIASLPISDQSLKTRIEKQAIAVQKGLDFMQGVMHTEFFIDDNGELIFLETNIRQAGGAINLIHKNKAGMSFETAMILLELDKPFDLNIQQHHIWDIGGYIPVHPGKITDIRIPTLKGEYLFDIRVNIGENHNKPQSASNAAASFFGQAASYDELWLDFLALERDDLVVYDAIA